MKGYDNFGNVCGEPNERLDGVAMSGINMTSKSFLMISVHRNTSLRSSCVHDCPADQFMLSIFNRCLPRPASTAAAGGAGSLASIQMPALLILDAFNVSKSVISAIASDTAVCWKELTYSASISFLISLLVLVLLRFVASIVIWSSLAGLAIASALSSFFVWFVAYALMRIVSLSHS